ncbi:MAG: site-specific DNA-methyltransferase [Treponema sp.]|nr:site-specific DNA-methyltransferase [Treponema sp.]
MTEKSYGFSWIDIPEQVDTTNARLVLVPEKCIACENIATGTKSSVPHAVHNTSVYNKTCYSNTHICDNAPRNNMPDAQHIFIEGDNYPALKCLLADWKHSIDMIYIDPPYNTGSNMLTYNDTRFLKMFPDGTRAPRNHPARHSVWLSFMYRRLLLARELLAQNGCMFISIDDTEYARLRLLCDEIFGEENYVNDFLYVHGKGKKDAWSRTMTQHTVCYARDKEFLAPFETVERVDWATTNADGDERGAWFSGSISFTEKRSNPNHANYFSITSPSGKIWTRQWLCSKAEMDSLIQNNRIYWGANGTSVPRKKIFNGEESRIIPKNIIVADTTREAQRKLDNMLCVKHAFANPKPVNLIVQLLAMTQMKSYATVLDFFAGSGTTLEAVLSMNARDGGKRRCILIQSSEKIACAGARVQGACITTGTLHTDRLHTNKSQMHSSAVHSTTESRLQTDNSATLATMQNTLPAPFSTIADITYERAKRIMCGYTDSTGKRVVGFGGTLAYYVVE